MGAVLIRSSFSANIKERRDCSTALFDERGRMIAQAEHIPVHLGAMPDAVAAVMRHDPQPDDVFVLNDPYAGGTHLPDITLVSRTDARLRGHARAPRRRRRRRAGQHARRLADAGRRGRRHPADAARRRDARRRSSPGCATPRSAAATSAPSSRHTASPTGGSPSSASAAGATASVAAMDELFAYSERVVRAAIARLPDGRFEARGRARGARGRPRDPRRGHDRRRRDRVRLRRHGAAARRATSTARSRSRARPATSSSAA